MSTPAPSAEAAVLVSATTEADLADLSRFLINGLPDEHGPRLFSPEMLRWKFLQRDQQGPVSFIARQEGRVVGHLGLALRGLKLAGRNASAEPLLAGHIIDWLTTLKGHGAGRQLLALALARSNITYALGGSVDAKRSAVAVGFQNFESFPVLRKVLRPGYRLRGAGKLRPRAFAAAIRDALRLCWPPMPRREGRWQLRRITGFGTEVAEIAARFPLAHNRTERSADLFNHLLACPGAEITGWHIEEAGQIRGYGLLNVVNCRLGRFGRLVECQLDAPADDAAWPLAIALLTAQLKLQGSDAVNCYASTPWLADACRRAGYHPEREQSVMVRDPAGLMAGSTLPFLLSQLEADHALV